MPQKPHPLICKCRQRHSIVHSVYHTCLLQERCRMTPCAHLQRNDGKVLRFWAMWDERGALYGDRRPYVVHYYLADDTMEVLEVHEMNSGRDPFPVFIARAPMPKAFTQPGFTVAKRADKRQCYTPADLRIGAVLDLHNRNMLLYMCDAFTKRWYMDNLGYTDEELCPMDIREEVRSHCSPSIPCQCLSL